jgi:hypothetical protein
LIDGHGEKDKIAAASIYEQFGNAVGILIAGEDPMAITTLAPSSKWKSARVLIADETPATLEFFSRLLEDRGSLQRLPTAAPRFCNFYFKP